MLIILLIPTTSLKPNVVKLMYHYVSNLHLLIFAKKVISES